MPETFNDVRNTLRSYHRELERMMSLRFMDHRPIEAMVECLDDVQDELAHVAQKLLTMESLPPDRLLQGVQGALAVAQEMFFWSRKLKAILQVVLSPENQPELHDFLALHALLQGVRIALKRAGVEVALVPVDFELMNSERS